MLAASSLPTGLLFTNAPISQFGEYILYVQATWTQYRFRDYWTGVTSNPCVLPDNITATRLPVTDFYWNGDFLSFRYNGNLCQARPTSIGPIS